MIKIYYFFFLLFSFSFLLLLLMWCCWLDAAVECGQRSAGLVVVEKLRRRRGPVVNVFRLSCWWWWVCEKSNTYFCETKRSYLSFYILSYDKAKVSGVEFYAYSKESHRTRRFDKNKLISGNSTRTEYINKYKELINSYYREKNTIILTLIDITIGINFQGCGS